MITINIDKEKEEKLVSKAKVIGDIAIKAAVRTLREENTYKWAGGIGLWQGLKYRGDFNRGIKAGLTTAGVLVAMNVIANVANQYDDIKNA